MTGRPIVGIFLALLVESAHWTKMRWDFSHEAIGRTWQVTVLIIAFSSAIIFIDTNAYIALPSIITWLPVTLLPMQFVQSFGLNSSIPLNTFSFFAKKRRQRNLRLGLTEAETHINFGNLYFVTTIIASTLGKQANWWPFLPGIVILTGWLLLSTSRSRPLFLMISLMFSGFIAVGGQLGIHKLQDRLNFGGYKRDSDLPNSNTTLIGKPGPIIQSPDIVWRLRLQPKSQPPKLLKTAYYNDYRVGTWHAVIPGGLKFKDLDTRLYQTLPYYILAENLAEVGQLKAVADGLRRFKLRGSVAGETPLPLSGDATSLRDFELDGVERHSLGTVRIFPSNSVIDGMVLWGGESTAESAPFSKEDLEVPFMEKEALKTVIRELKLDPQSSLEDKLRLLKDWFHQEFRYSRNPTIHSSTIVATKPTAITQFLTTNRLGHCEYFASAATLILRQAGIPTRYTTGYSVTESDAKQREYVIRGTHGHAWCRVWNAKSNSWLDFDTTPPSWLDTVSQTSLFQRMDDGIQRLREDFFIWRTQPSNRNAVTLAMSLSGTGLLAFIIFKLWRSKRQIVTSKKSNLYDGTVVQTPLNAIESKLTKHLGIRPVGLPLGIWLRKLQSVHFDTATLMEAIELHQRLRFDPATPDQTDLDRLTSLAKRIELAIR